MASLRIVPPALSLVLTAALLGGCSGGDGRNKHRLGTVSRGSVAEIVEAPATLTARANATLRSPAEGTVKELKVREGDRVKAGQILARIDSPAARQQLEQAQEADQRASRGTSVPSGLDLSGFRAQSDRIAKRGFSKARELAQTIPDPKERAKVLAEITKAEGDYALAAGSAQAAVSRLNAGLGSVTSALSAIGAASRVQTQAAVKAAQRTVNALTLKAPFSGVVSLGGPAGSGSSAGLSDLVSQQLSGLGGSSVSLPGTASDASAIAVGAPVSAGAAVLTVTDVSELRLTADIDESDILKIRRGGSAEADFDALPDALYTAEVYSVGVMPSESSGGNVTYKVQLTLKQGTFTDGSMAPDPKPGMSAVVHIKVREVSNVLVVPTTAIVTSGQNSTVWVLEHGKAVRRTVKLGAEGDTTAEVVSGLEDGDRIVVGSADSVKPGQDLT